MGNKALHALNDMHMELDYSLKTCISPHNLCISPTDPYQLTELPQKAKAVGKSKALPGQKLVIQSQQSWNIYILFLLLGPGQNQLWMLKSVNCVCSAERCSLPWNTSTVCSRAAVGGKFKNKTSDFINTAFQETPGWQLSTKPAFFPNRTSKGIATTPQPFCTTPQAKIFIRPQHICARCTTQTTHDVVPSSLL